MTLSNVDQLLWLASTAGNLALVGVLFYRKRARGFPAFTGLFISNLIRTLLLFVVYRKASGRYFACYWTLAIVDLVLQCAIAYEVASKVFRPAGTWARDTRRGWLLILALGVLLPALMTRLAKPEGSDWQELLVVKGTFFTSVLMAEIFAGMVILSVAVGLPWRGHVASIAKGFGIYSVVGVLIETGHNIFGHAYFAEIDRSLSRTLILVYLGCVVYWCFAMWRKPTALSSSQRSTPSVLAELSSLLRPNALVSVERPRK